MTHWTWKSWRMDELLREESCLDGRRLGGKAGLAKLAALSRIRRRPSRKEDKREEQQVVIEGEEEECREEESKVSEKLATIVLFHVHSCCGGFVPKVDLGSFPQVLTTARCKARLCGTSKNSKYCLVSVYFENREDGEAVFSKFAVKRMGKYRKVIHLGEQVYVHAVSKQVVFAASNENPFKELEGAKKPEDRGLQASPFEDDVFHKDLPTVLDEIGEAIVPVQDAFLTFASRSRSEERIRGKARLELALKELGLQDLRKLQEAQAKTELDSVGMEDFCKIYLFMMRKPARDTRTSFSAEKDARRAFDRFKLFPEDDFVDVHDIPLVLRCLGRRENTIRYAEEYLEIHGMERVTFPVLLDLLQ